MQIFNLYGSTVPAGECPRNAQGIIDLVAKYAYISMDEDSTRFVQGSTTPDADDQDKLWAKFDANGVWLGWYWYYNGYWRKLSDAAVGDIKWFSGDTSGIFDGTGLGLVNTAQDGWALCNGSNGTPDLRDKFIISANQYSSGAWKTNVTGALTQSGGEATHTLTLDELPTFSFMGAMAPGDGNPGAEGNSDGGGIWRETVTIGGGDPHNTLPPYYALAAVQFIGY